MLQQKPLVTSECLSVVLRTGDLFQHGMHQAVSEGNIYTEAYVSLQMYTDTGQDHIMFPQI